MRWRFQKVSQMNFTQVCLTGKNRCSAPVAPVDNTVWYKNDSNIISIPKVLNKRYEKIVDSAYSGLSHGLSALWTPAPHVLVQWDQDDQTPHPPWTASGVLPTVMHSPEKHHCREERKDKQPEIIITGKYYCELFVISAPEGQKLE